MSLTTQRPSDLDRKRFFIDGEWAAPSGDRVQEQIEAATGERIGVAALGTEADIDAAVRAARRALTKARGAVPPRPNVPRCCAGSRTRSKSAPGTPRPWS